MMRSFRPKLTSTARLLSTTVSALAFAAAGCNTAAPEPDIVVEKSASTLAPQSPLDGATIPKFVDPLPSLASSRVNGAAAVTVDMVEFQQKILPASVYASRPAPFNNGTFLWGYKLNGGAPRWPAQTIESRQNTATSVTYTNSLRAPLQLQKYLTMDQTLHWADPLHTTSANHCENGPPLAGPCTQPYAGAIPVVPHLHGAEVLSSSDGHPDAWFTPGLSLKGPGFVSNVYSYPNRQEATTLWFHDHALGMTRLNVLSGLAGFYLLRDTRDTGAASNPIGLPAGAFEQELLIADRQFDSNGQLLFPDGTPASNPTGINGPPPNPDHHPFWNPEFFGDVITVNGKSWPFMQVEPRRYRFRIVNGSNARFYRMGVVSGTPTVTPPPSTPVYQIGSDGGFMNAPVAITNSATGKLFLAPGERADVIVDFAGQSGKTFVITNDAEAPFPSGDPPSVSAPSAGQIMQFRVNLPLSSPDTSYNPAAPQRPLRAAPMTNIKPTNTRPANTKRQLVLVEVEGDGGPLEVLLNNSHWNGLREGTTTPIPGSISNGKGLQSTENPRVGATEVWEIANLTEDVHPIHLHLIQFQVIGRQTFDRDGYRVSWDARFPGGTFNGVSYPPGTYIPGFGPPLAYGTANAAGAVGGNPDFGPFLQGSASGPDAKEAGWKDTIKMLPFTITRIAVRYAPQSVAAGGVSPGTNLFPFDPSAGGPGYVWHCHILDHEDNEMMRPTLIQR
jgi:FtsP/CotA-like multicopper oxidase with cupredoxin domain